MSQQNKLPSRLEDFQEKRFIPLIKGVHLAGAFFIVVLMSLTFVHVVGRYAFNRPVLGVVELSCFALVIMIMLSGAYTMLNQGHTDMGDVLVGRFTEKTRTVIASIMNLLCLIFVVLVAWQSFLKGASLMQSGQTTLILQIPHFPFVYIVGIGWVIFSLAILVLLISSISKVVKK